MPTIVNAIECSSMSQNIRQPSPRHQPKIIVEESAAYAVDESVEKQARHPGCEVLSEAHLTDGFPHKQQQFHSFMF
jgi:hypothetical protein